MHTEQYPSATISWGWRGTQLLLRSAPKIFCAIADTLEWILFNKGVSTCIFHGRLSTKLGVNHCHLGIPLAKHQIEGPVTVIKFWASKLTLITCDKLDRLQALATSWMQKVQGSDSGQILTQPHNILTSRSGQIYTGGTFSCRGGTEHQHMANTVVLVSDASAFYGKSWLQCRWTHSWADINIAAKEFVPILGTWGHKWTGSHNYYSQM